MVLSVLDPAPDLELPVIDGQEPLVVRRPPRRSPRHHRHAVLTTARDTALRAEGAHRDPGRRRPSPSLRSR
ncbi:hypothetical protein Ae706Ps2_4476c [Pseudonocardia sp. Ae706_Ps2]|nr:hypothetical protein Ae706Ps2_4476c [Pseudonocardia sp. Ae706_Ps2]